MPEMGATKMCKNAELAGLRSWAVKGFEDSLIFYLVRRDAICVVRVLHGRRDIKRILEREEGGDNIHGSARLESSTGSQRLQ